MNDNNELERKKPHRNRQSGVKAEKKKLKSKPSDGTLSGSQKNPKAFAINSAVRAERLFRRNEDITAKRQHIPLVDQSSDEPPPILVAVVGPPKVGKTTLINNLIRNFTRINVVDIKGPITIVTSKRRRITLIECNNDINSMIDISKCADLVLLLCDASYGFEMEVFEFLNICQTHGMPRIMGVLTHLDMIKNAKQLKKRKKELKHRFWTEVYDGAKLFYLSGIIHGEYLRNEIKNLCRFISIIKFRPLTWRGDHSYMLVDRVEDITNADLIRKNPKCNRDVVLYGYVRGMPMKQELMVHIAGLGDKKIKELSNIPDPCPLPGTEKKRNLLEKERLLYAPMSGVGGIVYDKDAVYIELQGSHSHTNLETEQNKLVSKLIRKKKTVDEQIADQEFRLFTDGDVIVSKDYIDNKRENLSVREVDFGESKENKRENLPADNDNVEESEEIDSGCDDNSLDGGNDLDNISNCDAEEPSEKGDISSDEEYQEMNLKYKNVEGSDEEKVISNNMSWKEDLAQKARDTFLERNSESKNLMKLVYGEYSNASSRKELIEIDDDKSDELGGLFKVVEKQQTNLQKNKDIRDKNETCFFEEFSGANRNWLDEENKMAIKDCFVTGKWKDSEDAEHLLNLDDMSDDAASEVYGDFEDFETGEKCTADAKGKLGSKIESNLVLHQDNETRKRKITRVEEKNLTKAEIMAKKLKLKAKFDSEYDNNDGKEENFRITGDHEFYENLKAEAQKQSELNKREFTNLDFNTRLQVEGYRAGLYVRLGFTDVTAEFIEEFNPHYPILVGGLNMTEENIGYVNCKVKKHRWYKKILKTRDPLIISLGWRRFQTIPVFAKVEDNFRHRYLKYTPNHVTCSMTFWGPITPQNTGFLALQNVTHTNEDMKRIGFRIAATGCVTELDKSTQIQKKLKLVGHPFKIYKKTAFIKGMFNSSLEVAKFEGAKIKTVSGIRGQIKKCHHTPEGSFRATFEDKILLSDIVFCRTWFRVEVPKFYAPVTSLLLPKDQKSQWEGMKTLGQLKRERNIKNQAESDSLYTDIKREPKIFKPLTIPKALQRALPYKDKPKLGPLISKTSFDKERVAVIRSPHEQKVAKMLKMIETNYEDKKKREKIETEERLKDFKARKQLEEFQKLKRQKELRKKVSRALSKIKIRQKT